ELDVPWPECFLTRVSSFSRIVKKPARSTSFARADFLRFADVRSLRVGPPPEGITCCLNRFYLIGRTPRQAAERPGAAGDARLDRATRTPASCRVTCSAGFDGAPVPAGLARMWRSFRT